MRELVAVVQEHRIRDTTHMMKTKDGLAIRFETSDFLLYESPCGLAHSIEDKCTSLGLLAAYPEAQAVCV